MQLVYEFGYCDKVRIELSRNVERPTFDWEYGDGGSRQWVLKWPASRKQGEVEATVLPWPTVFPVVNTATIDIDTEAELVERGIRPAVFWQVADKLRLIGDHGGTVTFRGYDKIFVGRP